MELLNDLATSAASFGTVLKENFARNVLRELGVALCHSNTPLIKASMRMRLLLLLLLLQYHAPLDATGEQRLHVRAS